MRILVVEDEKLLCNGIAEDLELEKYTVERCYDGAEAYDLLLSESFDLLILDLNLPGMDGLDLQVFYLLSHTLSLHSWQECAAAAFEK